MIKNISYRFLVLFLSFLMAGLFAFYAMYQTNNLIDYTKNVHSNVIVAIDDIVHNLRDAKHPNPRHIVSQWNRIRNFNQRFPLNDNVDILIQSIDREIVPLVKFLGQTPNATSEALKVRLADLAHSLSDLKAQYIASFESDLATEANSIKFMFYVAAVLLIATIVLLTFLLLEVNSINARLQTYLEEREDYQNRLAKANAELSKYSEKLEEEVERRTEEALEHLLKNPLTKLPNRLSFVEKLQEYDKASVGLFNIDRFQSYNDLFGSKVGDQIIKEYAGYLRATIPYIYEIYHLQGDEFAIFEPNPKNSQTFLSLMRQISQLVHEFHFIDKDGDFVLQASIGVAIDQPQPLAKADMALRHAKHSNESMILFSGTLVRSQNYLTNITMTKLLTKAIKERRIVPYFQTIADVRDKKPVKYEVLARLIDDNGKVISPGAFMPLAKKIKLYPEITKIIFDKAMDVIETHGLPLSVNVSADDIHHIPTRDYIIDRLAMSTRSDFLTIELLESEEAKNYEDVQSFIRRVKRYGAQVAIDDFGSGYSNFAKILKLKVDYLKIDGSFIKKVDTDPDSREFVDIIQKLASTYHLKTVAEYVASEEIYKTVQSMGIDYVQGYYIAKPLPLEKILKPTEKTSHPTLKESSGTIKPVSFDWE
jgi:diguanylate cyclase (GGDEF)-like protein